MLDKQYVSPHDIPLGFIIYSHSGNTNCAPALLAVLCRTETLGKDATTQSTTNETLNKKLRI